jgi:hypothetical protein
VRKRICSVRAAQMPQRANGFADTENFGKKKCSITE